MRIFPAWAWKKWRSPFRKATRNGFINERAFVERGQVDVWERTSPGRSEPFNVSDGNNITEKGLGPLIQRDNCDGDKICHSGDHHRIQVIGRADLGAVAEYDRSVFAGCRLPILEALIAEAPDRGLVSYDANGRVTGYLFMQPHRIGPFEDARAILGDCRFKVTRSLRHMTFGPVQPQNRSKVWARFNHVLG